MKGDFTRNTFKPGEHYSSVRMQQGRVQLDADWNEQADLATHRVETETVDAIGSCGAPLHDAGFGIVTDITTLSAAEQALLSAQGITSVPAGNFLLSPGRFYDDGTLAENEHAVLYTAQPDLPGLSSLVAGTYLAYLDVWQRHLTMLEAPSIREVALGGPDTATRTRTVWQVRLMNVPNGTDCLSDLPAWDTLVAGSTGSLTARAQPETTSTDPCIVPASAGFRGLQNQLYRVEIHTEGGLNAATFKWSRDNGSVVLAIEEFLDGLPTDRLRMRSLGRDSEMALQKGDWVEVLDDNNELTFTSGALVQILDIDTDDLIITLSANVSGLDINRHPKVRRWDSGDAQVVRVPGTNNGFIPLEEGVEVKFAAGSYHVGDYWLIPARTILGNPTLTETGGIDWPLDSGGNPIAQPAEGIRHHYCRLAVITGTGSPVTLSWEDCRPLFPPATELVELFYLGGDGQEAMPGQALPQPLRAGVSMGQWPVEGARVRFHVLAGTGTLTGGGSSGNDITVLTGSDGIASATWQLDASTLSQVVEATLLDVEAGPEHLGIHYNANLSVASQVAYSTNCEGLQEADTVQQALDLLCENAALYYVGGDGQEAAPGQQLPFPLEVRLANGSWPVEGATIVFRTAGQASGILTGGGSSGPEVHVTTDADGLAACTWVLGPANSAQNVVAFWDKQPDLFIHFNAIHQTAAAPDPAMRIVDVQVVGKPLELDSVVPIAALKEGIVILLDNKVDPVTLQDRLVCAVTIDIPYPLNPQDVDIFHPVLIGFQPLRLNANLVLDTTGVSIHWLMGQEVDTFLAALLARMDQLKYGRFVFAHLTLKGNFVFSPDDPPLYVDGEAFALRPGASPTRLQLPSGNGVRGGTFETWFRISG
jgi:hypothetical protein